LHRIIRKAICIEKLADKVQIAKNVLNRNEMRETIVMAKTEKFDCNTIERSFRNRTQSLQD